MGARENVLYRKGVYPYIAWETEQGGFFPKGAVSIRRKSSMKILWEAKAWRDAIEAGDAQAASEKALIIKGEGYEIEALPDGTAWWKADQTGGSVPVFPKGEGCSKPASPPKIKAAGTRRW